MTRQDILSVNYAGEDGRYSCWLDAGNKKQNERKNRKNHLNKLYERITYYIACFQVNTYAYHWQETAK